MTTINVKIRDSQLQPLNGYLVVTLKSKVVTVAKELVVPASRQIELVSGNATFDLEPTVDDRIPYQFQVYKYETEGSSLFDTFEALVPDSPTPIELSDLALTTGISYDLRDTSYLSIARRLYSDELFWDKLRAEIFRPRGTYQPTSWYKLGDIVNYDGSSYLCISSTNIVGIVPTITASWQLLGSRGATGTGNTGNDLAYDSTAWNGQLDTPSRNAVRDIIETLARRSEVVLNDSASLLGQPTCDTPVASDNSQRIANTSWVRQYASPIDSPTLTGNVAVPTVATSDNSNKAASTSYVVNRINQILTTDTTFNIIRAASPLATDNSDRLVNSSWVSNHILPGSWTNLTLQNSWIGATVSGYYSGIRVRRYPRTPQWEIDGVVGRSSFSTNPIATIPSYTSLNERQIMVAVGTSNGTGWGQLVITTNGNIFLANIVGVSGYTGVSPVVLNHIIQNT